MSTYPASHSVVDVAATRHSTAYDEILRPPHQTQLLLAIADDDVADAAIRVTAVLAESRNASPAVLQVVDPSPYAPPPTVPTIIEWAEALIGPSVGEERRQAISTRVERVCGQRMPWPVVSRLGGPTACIADEAHKRHSEFLVLGLHHHRKIDQLLGEETTVHVLTNAGIPVLGVTRELLALPHRVLVGVDFSRASMRVAHLAARLIEPPGELVLVHVEHAKPTTVPEDAEGIAAIDDEGVHALLERLKCEVQVPKGVLVKALRLTSGDPGDALIKYAEHMQPDLIAVASQRHTRTTRLLLGSVTRHILRDARWSVLVTPAA